MGKTKIEWNNTDSERFWAKVQKSESCWIWQAGLFDNGYGQFRLGKRKVKAHCFSWVIYFGQIPQGKLICHRCDNKQCVNPSHLFIGTHKDNAQDRENKGRGGDGGSKTKKDTGMCQGIKNPAHKVNPLIVRTIRKYRRIGHTYQDLKDGIEFSFNITISKSQIANIVHRRSWKNVR